MKLGLRSFNQAHYVGALERVFVCQVVDRQTHGNRPFGFNDLLVVVLNCPTETCDLAPHPRSTRRWARPPRSIVLETPAPTVRLGLVCPFDPNTPNIRGALA